MERERILEFLAFYTALNRPLTSYELWRLLSPEEKPESFRALLYIMGDLEDKNLIKEDFGLLIFKPLEKRGDLASLRAKQREILQEKWNILLKYTKLFNFIPFVDFAIVAGSLALGNVSENSDFDIIIGCSRSKIFTARFFTLFTFQLFGKRRKSTDTKDESSNKFCFSHFVTQNSYALRPPYNIYWQQLYLNLVPVFGSEEKVISFFKSNKWFGKKLVVFDNKWQSKKPSIIRILLELILSTILGGIFESLLKKIQIARIKKENHPYARIFVSDAELEFHPDLSRINAIVNALEKL